MTLDEAIKEGRQYIIDERHRVGQKDYEAIQLGIEALERLRKLRENIRWNNAELAKKEIMALLPSETE